MFYTLAELVNVHSSSLRAQVNPFAMRCRATPTVTMKCPWINHLIPVPFGGDVYLGNQISQVIYCLIFFYKDVCPEIMFHSEMEEETINMLDRAE
jgi:hypothetical protein